MGTVAIRKSNVAILVDQAGVIGQFVNLVARVTAFKVYGGRSSS